MNSNDWSLEGRPSIGIECEFTKPSALKKPDEKRRWFRCTVIAYDDGEPVVKTDKGHYHRRPIGEYEFRPVRRKGRSPVEVLALELQLSIEAVTDMAFDDTDALVVANDLLAAGYRKEKQS